MAAGFALLLSFQGASSQAAEHRILFVPPPMEGIISLGIYNPAGKLVRVLRKEAEVGEFGIALNGLSVHWDGKDDTGAACPPGVYRARGVMVGEVALEGVAFLGNDWVTDETSPRIRRITDLTTLPDDTLMLKAEKPNDQPEGLFLVRQPDADADLEDAYGLAFPDKTVKAEAGALFQKSGAEWKPIALPEPTWAANALDVAVAKSGNFWVLAGSEVKQLSHDGGLLRTFAVENGEGGARAVRLVVPPEEDAFFVLEEGPGAQTLRGFDVPNEVQKAGTSSDAEITPVLLKKTILASDTFEQAAPTLLLPDGVLFTSATSVQRTLVENPLNENKPGTLDFSMGVDETGSSLMTADGLPIYKVSDTPHLRWAVLGSKPGANDVYIFQSDGAVIEEFKASDLTQMMTFDAGDVEILPPSAPGEGMPTVSPTVPPTGESATAAPTASAASEAATPAPGR